MRIALTFVFLFVALIVVSPAGLNAQVTTATLFGLVHDSSGAVVPGATVVATHQGTGVPREATTDERGEFVLSALPNGPYSVRIEMPGFKSYTNEGIALGRRSVRPADVRARARDGGGNRHSRGNGPAHRNGHVQCVRDTRRAGSARVAGEPP